MPARNENSSHHRTPYTLLISKTITFSSESVKDLISTNFLYSAENEMQTGCDSYEAGAVANDSNNDEQSVCAEPRVAKTTNIKNCCILYTLLYIYL